MNQDLSQYRLGLVTDFSPNSPKLRHSCVAYLLDNGFLSYGERDEDDLISAAQAYVDFVSGGNSEFLKELEQVNGPDDDALDDLFKEGDSGLYL